MLEQLTIIGTSFPLQIYPNSTAHDDKFSYF